jgi:hypothetical protein
MSRLLVGSQTFRLDMRHNSLLLLQPTHCSHHSCTSRKACALVVVPKNSVIRTSSSPDAFKQKVGADQNGATKSADGSYGYREFERIEAEWPCDAFYTAASTPHQRRLISSRLVRVAYFVATAYR